MEQPVKDKSPKPQGLMPKNLQAMVIAGLAFLMVAVMALTGRKAPQPVAATVSTAPPPPPPGDEAKILTSSAPCSAGKHCSPAATRPQELIRTNPARTLRAPTLPGHRPPTRSRKMRNGGGTSRFSPTTWRSPTAKTLPEYSPSAPM